MMTLLIVVCWLKNIQAFPIVPGARLSVVYVEVLELP
jgi:hypothetical protein